MAAILIVDDQQSVRESLSSWIGRDFEVETAATGEDGLAALQRRKFDLVLLDQRLPGMSGMDVLRIAAQKHPGLPVLCMTAFGSVDQAVEAVKLGAADYILKPIDLDTLRLRIDKLLSFRALAEENRALKQQLEERFSFHSIVTGDANMKETCARVAAVARSDAAIMILGESGTGKELVARAVHQASERAGEPFVTVACGAVPDTLLESELFGHEKGSFTGAIDRRIGKFEEAGAGTLFLDEIGELTPAAQVKLLRVIQEREFQRVGGQATLRLEARIVSATNRNLEEAIETGEFREDLFYRINTIRIDVPPLRNRAGDAILLAQHFLAEFKKRYHKDALLRIDPDALRLLQRSAWPGNVRELRGVIEQAVILARGDAITPQDLPDRLGRARNGGETPSELRTFHQIVDDCGRRAILAALESANGVKRDAASRLGLSQRALSHYLKKFGIT